MNKLRSDSVFSQLNPEQLEKLEDWLFEERLGYKEILEHITKEFGVATSLSGIRRYYQRLATERSHTSLMEAMAVSVEAAAAVKTTGALQTGFLTLAYKCAVEFMVQSPGNIRELTTLLRALTSAEALAMKRPAFQREEEEFRKKREQEEKEAQWRERERQAANEAWAEREKRREERKLAKALAAKAAEEAAKAGDGVAGEIVPMQADGAAKADASADGSESGVPEPDGGTLKLDEKGQLFAGGGEGERQEGVPDIAA